MKKFSFLAGMLTMALVGGLTVSALAASGAVSFNASPIQFNGIEISAKGEDYALPNGCMAPSSVTYTDELGGGTTYLPVRRIAELMGVEIGYDGTTGSVTVAGEVKGAATETPPVDYSDWSSAVDHSGKPLASKVETNPIRCFINDIEVAQLSNSPIGISYDGISYVNFDYICKAVGVQIELPSTQDWDRGSPAYIQLGETKYVSLVLLVSVKDGETWFFNNYAYDSDANALRLTM